jgi:hypothetical protein
MTVALAIGLGLAVLASLALNGSYLLQHAGSQAAPPIDARRLGPALRGLLRSRLWMAGLAAGLTGWALHVAALSQAPLSLVQAFAAGGLALVGPVGARALGVRMLATERLAILLMTGGLVMLALGLSGGGRAHSVPDGPLATWVVVVAVLAGALAWLSRGVGRPYALGAAGGMLYGAADSATKALTTAAHSGAAAVLESPWLLVVALGSAGAFLCFQRGLQSGPAVPVIALMTAATNVVAILAGLIVFGDPLGATPAVVVLHLAAFGLVGVAAWLLAPAQARLTTEQPVPAK